MSESTFNADLDALVQGEVVSSNDELTRFVSDLYGEEQTMMMPSALKLRIANDLGLTDEQSTIPAPISRRTARAAAAQRRSSRPWAIALTIAAAILLALTGVLRWGMPTSDNEQDSRFLFSSPAVPTVSATPEATPEISEWIVPYTDADCPEDELLDRSEWMEVQNDRAASYDQTEDRIDEPYSVPSIDDAEAAVFRQRQAMACMNRGESIADRVDALPIESPRKAWENSAQSDATREDRYVDRLERSKAFSSYVEDDLGISVNDLVHETDGGLDRFWDPANAVQMADGRVALVPSWTTNWADSTDEFYTFAPVWIEVDGEWLLDEELFFCIGECDEYWEQLSSVGTPTASPEASPVSDEEWMQPITPEECVTEDAGDLPNAAPEQSDAFPAREYNLVGPADPADASAANDVARQYFACNYPASLMSEQGAVENAMVAEGFSPFVVVLFDRQFSVGVDLSVQLENQGVTPDDAVISPVSGATWGDDSPIPNPNLAFELADGRIAVMFAATYTSDSSALGTTLVLVQEAGEWKVDEQLPVCIGDCGATFDQFESIYTDALWLQPITAAECEGNAYLPNGLSDEKAAAIKSRQYQACEMSEGAAPLQGPDYRMIEGEDAQQLSEEIETLHRQSGETPGSLQRVAHNNLWSGAVELPSEPWNVFQPESVVMLEDGRVAVLESRVVTPEIVPGSGRTSPVVTTALVWIVDGDSWQLDEEVTVCLGNCDDFWGVESTPEAATPDATVAAIAIPETCEVGDVFIADFTSHDRLPIQLRPEPITQAGVYVEVLMPRAPLQYLCESEETSNPAQDRLESGDRWLKVRTEDGTEGWIREIDVRELAP